MNTNEDVDDAIMWAAKAHRGQEDLRGEPYILHPLRVSQTFSRNDLRIVAILHDVLEDSNEFSGDDIRKRFGLAVQEAVEAMTRIRGEDYLEDYIPRVARNGLAMQVKKADIRDNLDPNRVIQPMDEEHAERVRRMKEKHEDALVYLLEHKP